MFDEETENAFSGGFKISEPGVATILGHPIVSNLKKSHFLSSITPNIFLGEEE